MKRILSLLLVICFLSSFLLTNFKDVLGANQTLDDEEVTVVQGVYNLDIDADRYLIDDSLKASKGDDDLPSSYNLADKGYVTSIKNQGSYGTCWAHAIMASAESSSIMDGEFDTSADLSEVNLAYFEYNNHFADDLNLITDDYSYSAKTGNGKDCVINTGGNLSLASLNLTSGIGFSNESRLPYSVLPTSITSFYISSFEETYIGGNENWCYDNDYRLVNIESLNMSQKDEVKKLLMSEGALAFCYYMDNDYYNSSTYGYYYYGREYSNHAVTLVGWDDNYSRYNFKSWRKPSSDGAWIVKNSYGTSWGNEGYFYLSYEDASIEDELVFSFDIEETNDDDYIYQYDGSFAYLEANCYSSSHYEANVFTAQRDEYLDKIGFYTTGSGVNYKACVYKNLSDANNPTSGIKLCELNGTATYGGYHSIDLNSPIFINNGDSFSIVINFSGTNSNKYYYDATYDNSWCGSSAVCSAGQSFYSSDALSWQDNVSQGNLRLKGYTSSALLNSDNTYATQSIEDGLRIYSNSVDLINDVEEVKVDSIVVEANKSTNEITVSNDELIAKEILEGEHTLTIVTTDGFEKNFTINIQYPEKAYRVTFNSNGGTLIGSDYLEVSYGSTYGELPSASKQGCSFVGWFTQLEGGKQISSESVFDYTTDVELYARFQDLIVTMTGKCGDNLTYSYYENGLLEISGSGAMYDYQTGSEAAPWHAYKNALTNIKLYEGLTSIGAYAFYECEEISSIELPNSLTSIGNYSFAICSKLSTIEIPKLVTTIGDYAFANCPDLSSINILASLKDIGASAFIMCTSLSEIELPDSLESIGESAFGQCTALETVILPSNLTSLSSSIFKYCSNLKNIDIPESVASIGSSAFEACTSLEEIVIPDQISKIESQVFYNCTGLKSITMPISIDLYNNSFTGVCNLTNIYLTKGSGTGTNFDSAFYKYLPWYLSRNNELTITLEDGITSIGYYTFADCVGLSNIVIPDTVTSIGLYAFENCMGLKSITLPISAAVGKYAFTNVTNLENINITKGTGIGAAYNSTSCQTTPWYASRNNNFNLTIEDGITSIGSYMFNGCTSLKSFKISSSLTSIGNEAFGKCTNLKSVYVDSLEKLLAVNFVSGNSNPLSNGANLYINNELVNNLVIPENITSISNYAFYNCKSLNSAILPSNIVSIGDHAFYGCSNLETIWISKNITTFGERIFKGSSDDLCIYTDADSDSKTWSDNFVYNDSSFLTIVYNTSKAYYEEYFDKYNVIFNTNCGEESEDIEVLVFKDLEYNTNYVLSSKNLPNISRTGYAFLNWNDKADGSGTSYYGDETFNKTNSEIGNMVLYAIWQANTYNIIYELDGGTNNVNNVETYTYASDITLYEPSRDGFIFEGWYLENEFINEVEEIKNCQLNSDLHLYAKWSLDTNVVFDEVVDEIVSVDSINATLNDGINLSLYLKIDTTKASEIDYLYVLYQLNDDEIQNVEFKDLAYDEDLDLYILTIYLNSQQINDNLTICARYLNKKGSEYETSISLYCDSLINGNYDTKTKNLAKAIKEYGEYAIYYFNETDDIDLLDSIDLSSYKYSLKKIGKKSSIMLNRVSLVLDSYISIKLYYDLNTDLDNLSFSIKDENNNDASFIKTDDYLIINNIKAKDLLNKYHIEVSNGETTIIDLTYSPISYAEQVSKLKGNQYNNLKNLVNKIYEYGLAAKEYIEE